MILRRTSNWTRSIGVGFIGWHPTARLADAAAALYRARVHPERPALIPSLAKWSVALSLAPPLLASALAASAIHRPASYPPYRAWCALARRVFGIRLAVVDHNPRYDEPPYVFLQLNQTSLSESFVTASALPLPFVLFANVEFAAIPLLGWLSVAQGAVVVVREWPAQARRAIDRAVHVLRAGTNFYMSIEGRRSPDGSLSEYKKGPAVLAIRAGAHIVPVVFRGAREVLPYGEWRVRSGTITVELLPAIDASALRYEDRHALVARLRALANERGLDSTDAGSGG